MFVKRRPDLAQFLQTTPTLTLPRSVLREREWIEPIGLHMLLNQVIRFRRSNSVDRMLCDRSGDLRGFLFPQWR